MRKSLNISLQAKKYQEPVNKILEQWEENGESLSPKLCEIIISAYALEKSSSIGNILNTYTMIRTILSRHISEKNLDFYTENIFSKILNINGELLTRIILNTETIIKEVVTGTEENINSNIENTHFNTIEAYKTPTNSLKNTDVSEFKVSSPINKEPEEEVLTNNESTEFEIDEARFFAD